MHIDRRKFVTVLAGTGTSLPLLAQQSGASTESVPFADPLVFKRREVQFGVNPYPMTAVRITGGVYREAAEWNREYMSRLAADRLLYNFRQNAGMDVKNAVPLGGWESPVDGKHGTELRGHFTGHFLSASANLYASMDDKAAKAKADYMVAELSKVQQRLGGGYLSAFPMELFDRLDALSGKPRINPAQPGEPTLPWAPFYTIHKIFAGMLDMFTLTHNEQALEIAKGMGNWADEWSAARTEEHMQQILATEFGGMGESLYNLAALVNDDRYGRAGDRFTKNRFVNPLALRRDELRGLHVNTHVPQVIAAARRYELSGDMRFHNVADFFFREVTTARTYVTGGTSNNEHWQTEPGRLAAELKRSVSTQECCCSYNMLKLTRHMYSWDPNPRYFDYYERALLNHRIGTIQPEKGHTQYFLSLTPGAWKTFSSEDQSFWCCTGTGIEEYAKLNDSIYWHDERGLYVNLFIASELNWTAKGLRVRQETQVPVVGNTVLTLEAERPVQLAIRLRIPSWTSAGRVKLNGRVMEAEGEPGSYFAIERVWKTGDRIELEMPMHLSVEAMPDDPGLQAFLYGPLVLAGDLGKEDLNNGVVTGLMGPPFSRQPAVIVPSFRANGQDPASWLKPTGQPLTFRTTGQKQDVTMMPLNSLFDRRYSVYWEVS